MWILISGTVILLSILSIIYLGSRFARFSFIHKIAKERKAVRFIAGVVPVLLILAGTGIFLGIINAMICILHLMVIWLVCDGIRMLLEKKRKKEFSRYYAGVFAIGITAVYLVCGWYLANHVFRTEYTIATDKPVGSLRIVQFADSHVGTTFDGEEFGEQVKAMQSENPDIVVVTGDYVDDDTTKEDMIAACQALGTLKTTYGVYYAFGNHDKGYYGDEFRGYSGDDLIAELEKNHVNVLQDETVLLDNRFYLIGRQDRSEEQRGSSRASMQELTAGLDASRFSIVLDHQPQDYEAQEASGVDLVLSGHTHGGQFFPVNYMGEWTGINDKTYGLEKRQNTNFIVTSGISDWALSFKTGCKSEYVVVDVKGGDMSAIDGEMQKTGHSEMKEEEFRDWKTQEDKEGIFMDYLNTTAEYAQVYKDNYYFLRCKEDDNYIIYMNKGQEVGTFHLEEETELIGFVKNGDSFFVKYQREGEHRVDLAKINLEENRLEFTDSVFYTSFDELTTDYFFDDCIYSVKENVMQDKTEYEITCRNFDGAMVAEYNVLLNNDNNNPYQIVKMTKEKILFEEIERGKRTFYVYDLLKKKCKRVTQLVFPDDKKINNNEGQYKFEQDMIVAMLSVKSKEHLFRLYGINYQEEEMELLSDKIRDISCNDKYIYYIDKDYVLHKYDRQKKTEIILDGKLKIMSLNCTSAGLWLRGYDELCAEDSEGISKSHADSLYYKDYAGDTIEIREK